jgi:sterol desaturase/sphingolipid hydroxylase (fatty acid hydroxylase superfamily)
MKGHTMDDLQFGSRNKRGDWAPAQVLELAPFWSFRPAPAKLVGWVKGYVWPWNLLFLATTALWWALFVPETETLRTLSAGWVLTLLAANWIGIFCLYGGVELRYYVRRVQDRRFKYNGKFPAEQASDVFWFKSQNLDNFLRSFLVSVPIGTAIEVLLLWAFASGHATTLSWADHPAALVAWVLLVPLIHELHFFIIHRAIHWGPLYRWVHSVHHNSVNPSPWSSLSMHPVEATAYFGVALWVLALPSHPFVAVYFVTLAGFGAIVGHIGFDRLELGAARAPQSHAYAHYLHHKYFEVNYCDNGVLPLDQWFGSWHDGSPEGERLMQARFKKKRERLNAA